MFNLQMDRPEGGDGAAVGEFLQCPGMCASRLPGEAGWALVLLLAWTPCQVCAAISLFWGFGHNLLHSCLAVAVSACFPVSWDGFQQ